ncbi:MAG: hypothetical protein IT520_11465 [Burkholderiales bacterium]|nr:hypothetical protein [Burkholderiales bacterium]
MTISRSLAGFAFAAFAALVSALAAAQAVAPGRADAVPTPEQLERRLASVQTLITTSSGARQIAASGVAAAATRHAEARRLYEQARTAAAAGDAAGASKLLDASSKSMFEAVRLAAPESVVAEKQRADFEARFESTKALLEAQKRIAAEKGGGAPAEVTSKIEGLLVSARRSAGAGDYAAARTALDQAYVASKAAIGSLRGGDTLVRSLNFASKEEEYHYELDRNDTHRMLVDVLTKGKTVSAATETMIRDALAESGRLRGIAETQAAQREFERGIGTLEDSTRALVRAIRAAGVFIPG